MAEITRFPFVRHLRSEPSQHILRFRKGRQAGSGRGLSFWFTPLNAAVAAVPVENLDLAFMFAGRSKDFQEINVQGVITYRVADPAQIAERVDFSLDLATGAHKHKPLERIAGTLTELAQQLAMDHMGSNDLARLLNSGAEEIRKRIDDGLRADQGLTGMALTIVSVRVSSVVPSAEMEKALRVPVREAIQQEADEATFRRRAQAVEKERAIQENELQNKIELAKREQQLIEQKGENERRRITDETGAAQIAAEGQARRTDLLTHSKASEIKAVEEARVTAERDRMLIYRDFPADRLMALAMQELAGKLKGIDHVTITPDHVGSLLKQLGLRSVGNTTTALPGKEG
jgi:regulator of protease activity HflC (stomatin/prohibitin superfamily)